MNVNKKNYNYTDSIIRKLLIVYSSRKIEVYITRRIKMKYYYYFRVPVSKIFSINGIE